MTPAMIYVILVLAIPLTLVFMNRLREDTAALLMVCALMIAQIAGLAILGPANTPSDSQLALRGFGSPEIITLISLFILTTSLEKYGLTSWIASKLVTIGGKSESRLIGLFSLTAALLSMIMNNLAAGALLLPSALEASRRSGVKPSKLLIPIAYGTMLGGASTYLATANIIMSGMLRNANPPQPALGILDFTPTGGLIAIAGILFLTFFGKYVLPDRKPPTVYRMRGSHGLTRTYHLQERMWEVTVPESSPVVNQEIAQTGIGANLGVSVLAAKRGSRILPVDCGDFQIHKNDILIAIGREERVKKLEEMGLVVKKSESGTPFDSSDTIFAEVIVPPRSDADGKTLRDLAFRAKSGFSAIALWRENRSIRTDVAQYELQAGDTLLCVGQADNLQKLKNQTEFILAETAVSGEGMEKGKVFLTLGIVATAIAVMIAGIPVEIAMLTAAVVLLLTGLITMEEAYRSIKWRAIFLIAGVMSVSVAMVQTGLAGLIGDSIVKLVEPFGALGLVTGAYIISAGLTQMMGAQISPLVTGPIVISAAIELGINPQAIAVVTAISTAISFITPLSHPVNLIMIAPANYTFKDFFKSGIGLTVVCFIAMLISVQIFWKL